MAHVDVQNLGVTGWLGSTVEKGGQALCGTICGCIMVPVAVALVFYGEYNYVKDLNNIYHIKKDIVDVTSYDATNDGKPVAYYGEAVASSLKVDTWGFTAPNTFGVSWSGEIYRYTVSTKEENNKKAKSYNPGWSYSKGDQATDDQGTIYNNKQWTAPCDTGSAGTASCSGSRTNSNFKVGNWTGATYLADDYITRTTSQALLPSSFYNNCTQCKSHNWFECNTYLSTNTKNPSGPKRCASPGMSKAVLNPGDQYVPFKWYPSNVMVTVCSRQEAGATWKRLYTNGNYDIMTAGKKTSDECVDIMNAQASATVFVFRIVGFFCFWCGFVLLLSFVEFIADRIGQLIPCGLGEALEEMIQCLVCMVTCPPACMCWLFWFALAWLCFRPLIGAPLVAVALCGFGLMYWHQKNVEKKQSGTNNYAPLNNNTGYKPPEPAMNNSVQQPPQPNYQPNYQPQPAYQQPNQQYQPQPAYQQPNQQHQPQPAYQQPTQPYQPNQPYQQPNQPYQQPNQPAYQPNVAPPPVYAPQQTGMVDANNNGVPDQYEINLPPGYQARMDPNSNRVYWVNHNNNGTTWIDPRGPQPNTVGV